MTSQRPWPRGRAQEVAAEEYRLAAIEQYEIAHLEREIHDREVKIEERARKRDGHLHTMQELRYQPSELLDLLRETKAPDYLPPHEGITGLEAVLERRERTGGDGG